MKCAFLLGSAQISGGTYVIFEHAVRMQRMGMEIFIIAEEPVTLEQIAWHQDAKELHFLTFSEAKDLVFDLTLATWWRTVYELHRVRSHQYGYFVQSIETRFYPEKDKALRKLVESTYLLGLPVITEATWIQQYLSKYSVSAQLVKNGLRKDIYCLEGAAIAPRSKGKLRILVEGPLGVFFKNTEKAIQLALASEADEVWLLTSSDIKDYPGVNRVFSRIPMFETAKIYRSCDILLKLSYVEGMFGPPLEMFGCGGSAIVYNVTGHDEYIRHGQNALVLNRDDESGVVKAINLLRNNIEQLMVLKSQAQITAQSWPDWNDQSKQFKKASENILTGNKLLAADLHKQTQLFFGQYVAEERACTLLKDKFLHWLRSKPLLINTSRKVYSWIKRG